MPCGSWGLSSQPGTEPGRPAVKTQNSWTAREFPEFPFLFFSATAPTETRKEKREGERRDSERQGGALQQVQVSGVKGSPEELGTPPCLPDSAPRALRSARLSPAQPPGSVSTLICLPLFSSSILTASIMSDLLGEGVRPI